MGLVCNKTPSVPNRIQEHPLVRLIYERTLDEKGFIAARGAQQYGQWECAQRAGLP
jgi:hypothetical protein